MKMRKPSWSLLIQLLSYCMITVTTNNSAMIDMVTDIQGGTLAIHKSSSMFQNFLNHGLIGV